MTSPDTIAAISSAVGVAARMIVRLSGPAAFDLARTLVPDLTPSPSTAHSCRLRLSTFSLPITLYTFLSPHSYTGEDLVELHLPGNPLLARLVLEHLLKNGARLADPGEFTARAYFHGRLDLTEAEGVAATIAARGEQELRAARQLLSGELARRIKPVTDLVAETLALVEVGIDFTEEDVTFVSAEDVRRRVADADARLAAVVDGSARFERLTHEPRVVLVGRPNAGKSTLLNTLAGRERAIVSPVAGTTRDAISAEVVLERGTIRLVDVAGLDDAEGAASTDDAAASVARQMRERALREVETADHVVLVHVAGSVAVRPSLPREPDLVVLSKSDLAVVSRAAAGKEIPVSAVTGANVELLLLRLDSLVFGSPTAGASLGLNARHLEAMADARAALGRADRAAGGAAELLAVELREALDALGRIVGNISADDLLGRIFSKFCIGK